MVLYVVSALEKLSFFAPASENLTSFESLESDTHKVPKMPSSQKSWLGSLLMSVFLLTMAATLLSLARQHQPQSLLFDRQAFSKGSHHEEPSSETVNPPDQGLGEVTYPYLDLTSPPNSKTFVPAFGTPLCVRIFNAQFSASFALTLNGATLSPTITDVEDGQEACVATAAFTDGENIVGATDGALSLSSILRAGSSTIQVNLQDSDGSPFLGTTKLTARLSDDSFVTSTVTTSSGSTVFQNLPQRTVTFAAMGPGSEIGSNGANPRDTSALTIVLVGFNPVSTVDNNDFSMGLEGWDIPMNQNTFSVQLVPHVTNPGPFSRRSLQSLEDMCLATAGVEGPQSVSRTFTSSEDACAVKVRYRFVTSEVPGGFFGTEYNDYFSVSIRAQRTGDSVVETNTMNGLGLAAFDGGGSTSWRETTLSLEESFFGLNDQIQVDVQVANVEDNLFDSQVYVDFVEEIVADSSAADDECACALCKQWAEREIADRGWIDRLPRCPCSVVSGARPCTVRPTDATAGTGTFMDVNWDTDLAMNPCVDFGFHPGASSCIRAAGPGGTGQQCCYGGTDSRILPHGSPGAGTPDRNFPDHTEGDVDTYNLCCKKCPSMCSMYIGATDGTPGARSDTRHSEAGCVGS